ncbi:MAG: hypothetical protein AB7V42_09330 [Thermoleophilia bacterium]
MSPRPAPEDDPLVRRLGDLLERADPVPPDVTLAARSALAWRRIDAELAELLDDTALTAAAGVRSAAGVRTLTFQTDSGGGVEIEVHERAGRRLLVGQVVPPQELEVRVRHPGGTTSVTSDALGRFRAEGVHPGRASLRCEPAGGGAFETPWMDL